VQTTEDTVRQTTKQRRRAVFEEAVQVIERKYATDLDLDALAREIATSRRQLQRVFAEVGGTSFREYLAKVRMRHAARLLREGAIPVREVAQSVGYRQPAQFAKAFRRHHGSPPSSLKGRAASTNGHGAEGSRA
jgi:AraC family transcriptional regulator, regulatory protein of adaptative response / methylphosphotriester-DNA alkyltransferase methyltransferase